MARRPFGSGQHGKSRKKLSEYATHLREKQKVRHSYLILEKQFASYFYQASHKKGVTGTILLQMLESRFDNVIYASGLIPSKKQARQFIRHRHFIINGRVVDIPSYRLKAGDEISVKAASYKLIKQIIEDSAVTPEPQWLSVNRDDLKVKVVSLPEREQINAGYKEQLIIEYYSK